MRKLIVLLALSLGTALAEPPKLAVDSDYAAGGQVTAQVRNDSDMAVTAFVVGTSDKEFASFDSLLGARDGRVLRPSETTEVQFPSHTEAEARVLAVIFEDGTTTGDRRWVHYLIDAREDVRQQLPLALAWLQHATSPGVTASTVAFWFRSWQDNWHASDASRVMSVPLAAEIFLARSGNQPAEQPARELIQVFEEMSAKLAASKPEL